MHTRSITKYECRDCKKTTANIPRMIEHRISTHNHLYLYDFRKIIKTIKVNK